MISLSIPKKTEKELIIFFKKNNLNLVVNEYLKNKKNLHHGKFIKKTNKPYPPILDDLYKIFYIVTKFKRITCLEFGTGWSTLVIAKALSENKKKYEKHPLFSQFCRPSSFFFFFGRRLLVRENGAPLENYLALGRHLGENLPWGGI